MEGLEEATVTLKGAFDVTASVVSEATVSTSAPAAAPVEVDEGKYTLVLSGHRYSPNNFWCVPLSHPKRLKYEKYEGL